MLKNSQTAENASKIKRPKSLKRGNTPSRQLSLMPTPHSHNTAQLRHERLLAALQPVQRRHGIATALRLA